MKTKRKATLTIALAVAASFTATTAREAHADEVDDLFKRGRTAFDDGRYSDAEFSFEKAFALRKSPDIAGNLAQTELKLKKNQEAANHLAYALRFLPATAKPVVKEEMRASLAALEKELGRLTFAVNVTGATIKVGSETLGTSPLEDSWYVEPGAQHQVTVELAGHKSETRTVSVEAGKNVPVPITLQPTGTETGGDSPPWLAIGLGVAGGAVLLGGAGMLGAAFAVQSSASDEATPGACAPGAPICEEVGGQLDTANALGVAGFIGLGLGAAGLVGMAVVLAVGTDDSKDAAMRLELAPGLGGLMLKGSF